MKTPRNKRPLDAAEIADAAVTTALVLCLLAIGRLLALGSMLQMFASCIVAVLAARRRSRVVYISSAAAASLGIILGGLGPVSYAFLSGVFGWTVGQGLKRKWPAWATIAATIIIGWPLSTASLMLFYPAVALNQKLRDLVLDNIEDQFKGYANITRTLAKLPELLGLTRLADLVTSWATVLENIGQYLVEYWYLIIPASEFVSASGYAVAIYFIAKLILNRVDATLVEPRNLDLNTDTTPQPVPLKVRAEPLRRNGVIVANPIELEVRSGQHLVISGPNGAGKSTLLDTIAGIENSDLVERSGPVGLGSVGGTARVGQRPEAQVIGANMFEDLSWGVDEELDFDAVRKRFGLEHIEAQRSTADMSGGELQRLALASAMRRKPKLLLADEVTSMLDPQEQARVIENLASLEATAIVRTSHRDDVSVNDRIIRIEPLKRTDSAPETGPGCGTDNDTTAANPGAAESQLDFGLVATSVSDAEYLLDLDGVGYAHDVGKAWQHQVLSNIDMKIGKRELITIEGHNGSGKTTLARILAGLSEPTEGAITCAKDTRRALARQHVRLQLLRPTVALEIASLAGVRTDGQDLDHRNLQRRTRARNVQTAIGLFDLGHMLDRRIDSLSGGEQRRVLLAGLVARGVNLLILDEPLAGLDAGNRHELALTLERIRLAGTTIILITHDIDWQPIHRDRRYLIADGSLSELPVDSQTFGNGLGDTI